MNDFFGYALLSTSISWCFQHTHLGSNIFYPNYRILKQKNMGLENNVKLAERAWDENGLESITIPN